MNAEFLVLDFTPAGQVDKGLFLTLEAAPEIKNGGNFQ
jgi:hypothetical protein